MDKLTDAQVAALTKCSVDNPGQVDAHGWVIPPEHIEALAREVQHSRQVLAMAGAELRDVRGEYESCLERDLVAGDHIRELSAEIRALALEVQSHRARRCGNCKHWGPATCGYTGCEGRLCANLRLCFLPTFSCADFQQKTEGE